METSPSEDLNDNVSTSESTVPEETQAIQMEGVEIVDEEEKVTSIYTEDTEAAIIEALCSISTENWEEKSSDSIETSINEVEKPDVDSESGHVQDLDVASYIQNLDINDCEESGMTEETEYKEMEIEKTDELVSSTDLKETCPKKYAKSCRSDKTKNKYEYFQKDGHFKNKGGPYKQKNDSESDDEEAKASGSKDYKQSKKKIVSHRKFDRISTAPDVVSKSYDKNKSREKMQNCETNREKSALKKENNFPAKIVVRRLPPNMTAQMFISQVSPLPDYNNFYFVKADKSYSPYNYSRAYLNFVNAEDIYNFKDKFDNYVFVDVKGNEYPAVVEFAIFQRVPKRNRFGRKKDNKCGTVETDPTYLRFNEEFNREPLDNTESKPEYSFHIKEAAKKGTFVSTPLIEYINMRKQERLRIRDERKAERRKLEMERKRIKDEERRKRKVAAKEAREKQWKNIQEDDSDIKEEVNKCDIDEKIETDKVSTSHEFTKKPIQARKERDDGDKEREHRDSHGSDHIESTSFSKTRRESFGSDRSDFSRGNKRDNRINSKHFGRKPDTGSRSDGNNRGPKPFKKEPFKPIPRFVPNEKMGKDGFGREDRFSKFKKTKTEYQSKAANFYEKDYRKPHYKKSFDEKTEQFPKKIVKNKTIEEDSKNSTRESPDKSENNTNSELEGQSQHERSLQSNQIPDEDLADSTCQAAADDVDDSKLKDDPRKQRRIRNKDRPAMAIYRPGMIRNTRDKRGPSSELTETTEQVE